METFSEYLHEHIKSSGITWRHASKVMGIPYSTLMMWKNEETQPPEYVQELVKEKIKSIF